MIAKCADALEESRDANRSMGSSCRAAVRSPGARAWRVCAGFPEQAAGAPHRNFRAGWDPAVAARMESQAGQIIGGSPAELDALVSKEIRQFTQVVREQGLKPE